jgi:DNA-binding MarR family transcriptional regulator
MPWVGQRVEFIRHVGDRLGLSPEQRERIEKHIKESQQRMRELWEIQEPQFKAEMTRVREQVEAELTPEQREKFAELQKQRPPGDRNSNRWRDPRRRGPGGEGSTGPGPGPGPDSGRQSTNAPTGDSRPPAPAP